MRVSVHYHSSYEVISASVHLHTVQRIASQMREVLDPRMNYHTVSLADMTSNEQYPTTISPAVARTLVPRSFIFKFKW